MPIDPAGGVRLRFEWERRLRDDPEASGARMSVLLVMATHFNRRTERISVSRAKVAQQSGVTERTVTRVLDWAEGRYLHRESVGRSVGRRNAGRASVYELRLPLSAGHFSGTSDDFSGTSDEFQRDIAPRADVDSAGHPHAVTERGQSTCTSELDPSERARAFALKMRPARWPDWCGQSDCEPQFSRIEDEDHNILGRCKRCHPQEVGMPKRRRSA